MIDVGRSPQMILRCLDDGRRFDVEEVVHVSRPVFRDVPDKAFEPLPRPAPSPEPVKIVQHLSTNPLRREGPIPSPDDDPPYPALSRPDVPRVVRPASLSRSPLARCFPDRGLQVRLSFAELLA